MILFIIITIQNKISATLRLSFLRTDVVIGPRRKGYTFTHGNLLLIFAARFTQDIAQFIIFLAILARNIKAHG